jgi:hypothetical protein
MRLVRRGSLGVRADLDLAPAQCAGDSKLIEQYEAHQGRVMLPEVASCFPRSLHVWSTMKDVRIAILGGGILGTCTALELARRGRRSTLFEGQSSLLQGASRWNEGKIHLGFLYAGDPTLRTAQRLIPGGLAFAGLVERLIQRSLDEFVTEEDDILSRSPPIYRCSRGIRGVQHVHGGARARSGIATKCPALFVRCHTRWDQTALGI